MATRGLHGRVSFAVCSDLQSSDLLIEQKRGQEPIVRSTLRAIWLLVPDPFSEPRNFESVTKMNDSKTCSRVNALLTRRDVLQSTACGFGWMAFSALAGTQIAQAAVDDSPLAIKNTPLKPRAKRVIFLCMSGAPSHVDLLDYKPQLNRDSGKPGPRPGSQWLGSKWKFAQQGQSGLWMSELLPQLAKHADKLCVVSSMQTDVPAHPGNVHR